MKIKALFTQALAAFPAYVKSLQSSFAKNWIPKKKKKVIQTGRQIGKLGKPKKASPNRQLAWLSAITTKTIYYSRRIWASEYNPKLSYSIFLDSRPNTMAAYYHRRFKKPRNLMANLNFKKK